MNKYGINFKHLIVGLSAGIVAYILTKRLTTKPVKKANLDNIFKSNAPIVCSHISEIEGGSKAQNNLGNIQKLLDANVGMIELDVQITKDGVPVLYHDNTLSEKTNGTGAIPNLNWNEVSKVRYKADKTQGITKLADAISVLKKSGKPTIFQLDKCDGSEIAKINSLGLFDGVQKQMLTKAMSFSPTSSIVKAGLMYMPIIPTNYVGRMNNEAVINEIVSKCKGYKFLEAQFSDADTLLLNGTLAKKLNEIGCRLMIVAVVGGKNTNPVSYRGDNEKQWSRMLNNIGAGVIMTNRPLALQKFIAKNK